MKTHIYYFLIILFTVISLPLHAVDAVKASEDIVSQEMVVDINKADIDTLVLLKGIGEKRAKAIVAYRELNGSFSSVEDLLNVKGIGQRVLEQNKARIKL
jgi:competence protein ComEA|tara:strand:+ start:217 stop:516 length:300 start_codon:yes stop_codon:yes gene_type:complete